MRITPYELMILVDVFVGTPIRVNHDAPIYEDTIAKLVDQEYLLSYGDSPRPEGLEYAATVKLHVLMNYILSAPEPIWKMP